MKDIELIRISEVLNRSKFRKAIRKLGGSQEVVKPRWGSAYSEERREVA